MLRTPEEPIPLIMQTQHRGFVFRIQWRNFVSQDTEAAEIERYHLSLTEDEHDLQLAQYCAQLRASGGEPNLDLLDETRARKILALSFSFQDRPDETDGSDTESGRKTTITWSNAIRELRIENQDKFH